MSLGALKSIVERRGLNLPGRLMLDLLDTYGFSRSDERITRRDAMIGEWEELFHGETWRLLAVIDGEPTGQRVDVFKRGDGTPDIPTRYDVWGWSSPSMTDLRLIGGFKTPEEAKEEGEYWLCVTTRDLWSDE